MGMLHGTIPVDRPDETSDHGVAVSWDLTRVASAFYTEGLTERLSSVSSSHIVVTKCIA